MQRNIEKYTADYMNEASGFEYIQAEFRKRKVLEVLNHYKPQNVLEIGCGFSSIANDYKTFDKFTIVEPSKEFAQNGLKEKNDNVIIINDFVENRIDELKKSCFDFIICSGLLHEVFEPDNLLEQIRKLCGKDTILHINVPNSRSFHILWAYEAGYISSPDELTPAAKRLQRNSTFDMNKLKNTADRHGFKVISSGSYFIKPFNQPKMKSLIDNNIIDDKLLNALYSMDKYMPEMGSEIYVSCKIQ